jgi:hypothetical protein
MRRKKFLALSSLLLLMFMTSGCGVHRITSNPSGATVCLQPGGASSRPSPKDLYCTTEVTPYKSVLGPFSHWYRVKKVGYEDSEPVNLPAAISSDASYHFTLKPIDYGDEPALTETAPKQLGPAAPKMGEFKGIVLAVFDIEDVTKQLKEQELNQLQDFLETRLTELAGFKIVPREQLKDRLQEQKTASYRKCYDEACQIELGKEVAAGKSLSSRILRVGSTCVVTSKLFDLKTATSEKAASARVACNPDGLLDGMDQLAKQLSAP